MEADCLFSNPQTGKLSEITPKFVLASYREWTGLIPYAGIARDPVGLSTSDWLVRTLSDGRANRTFEQVIEEVRSSGTRWLRRVLPEYRRHTFIFGAIVNGKVRVAMVSNFQSFGGAQLNYPKDDLFITPPKAPKSYSPPRVVISGVYAAAKQYRKYLLEIYTKHKVTDPSHREQLEKIQRLIAGVNVRAAHSPAGEGLISEQCLVFSLFPNSDGSCALNGGVQGDLLGEDIFLETVTQGRATTEEIRRVAQTIAPNNAFRFVGLSVKVVPATGMMGVMWALRPRVPVEPKV